MHTMLVIPTFCVIAVRLPRLVMSIIYRWCNINRTRLHINRTRLHIVRLWLHMIRFGNVATGQS